MATRKRFSPASLTLNVKRSRTGLGIFAGEMIPKGTCVIEYTGRSLTVKQYAASRSKYLFETGKNTVIDGSMRSNTARYINHSCLPNCEIEIKEKRVFIFSKRRIKAGEELTYDYDTEYFEAYIKPKGCRCRKCSPNLY